MIIVNNISKITTYRVFFLAVFILLDVFTASAFASTSINSTASVIPTVPGGGGGGSYTLPVIPIPTVPQANRCSNFSRSSDINNDGSVGIFDFNLLMVKWGSVGQNISADINCDESVDIFDFNLLMVNWGKTFQ
jgi:hypothetical protein